MNEELLIKVKVDTSSVTSSINKLKNEVSNVNKAMDSSASSSAKTTKSTNETAKATDKVKQALAGVTQQLRSIQGMEIIDTVATVGALKTVKDQIAKVKKAMAGDNDAQEKQGFFSNMFSSFNPFSKDMEWEGFKGALENFKLSFEGFSEKVLGKAFKMPKSLKELKGSLGDIGKLAGGFVTSGLKTMATALASVAAAAGTAIAVLGGLLVVLVPLFGIFASFKTSKLGNEIYHLAQRFNMSTQSFQEWSYIMERSGGSIDDLTGFMETLASEQAAVIEGSADAAANFERLGLSMEEVSGMRQQELFETTVSKIQSIEDATQRSAIAYSIFGDEASKFMNVLNMSNSEMSALINNYHLLGGAMSGELLEKSNSLQNSIANLKQAWQGISNTLAEVFIPIVQAVVKWITKALVIVNLFLRSIFGLDLKTKSAAGSTGGATSGMKSYANATKAATKAAEEFKRTTMGFDELNIVQDPNKSSGSSGSGAGASAPNMGDLGAGFDSSIFEASDLNLEGIYAWFEKYKGLIRDITTVTLTLGGVAAIIFGIMGANPILVASGIALLGGGIAIGTGEDGLWTRIGTAIANFCKKAAAVVVEWVSGLIKKLGEFGTWIYTNFISPIVEFFKKMWAKIVEIFTPVVSWFTQLFTSVWNSIKSILDVIVGLFKGAWLLIKTVWGVVASWFKETIISPISNFFSGMWNGIKNAASKAWSGIKSVFSPVVSWFKDKFSAAWNAVKNIFSVGGKIFDGIKEGIAKVFKTVVNGIIGGINKVIAVPFNAINSLLNKLRNVSVAGIEPFKGFIKYNALSVPQIPKLATGGIITGESLFVGGEGGKKEAVLPLEQNTGWMDALADRIAARNSAPSKIVLQIGEKEFAWAAINGINNITKQTGGIQLAL